MPSSQSRATHAREQVVKRIISAKDEWARGGVYGADICALCGRTDSFQSHAKARFGSYFGPDHEFVCRICWRELVPKGENGIGAQRGHVSSGLRASFIRYCPMCRLKIDRHPSWGQPNSPRIARLCPGCSKALSEHNLADEEVRQFLDEIVKRRFLWQHDLWELEAMVTKAQEQRTRNDD